MPLTERGRKVLAEFENEYGPEKGRQVFYASINAGKLKGMDTDEAKDRKPKVFVEVKKRK